MVEFEVLTIFCWLLFNRSLRIKLFHNFLWMTNHNHFTLNIWNKWKAKRLFSYYQTIEVLTPQQSGNNWVILWLMFFFMQHVWIMQIIELNKNVTYCSEATWLSRCEHLGSLVATEQYRDRFCHIFNKQTINFNSCQFKFNIRKKE